MSSQGAPAIAIDFGTSRTKLSWYDASRREARLMRLGRRDDPFIPSLFYLGRDGSRLLGEEAADALETDPAGMVDVLKRRLRQSYLRANGQRVQPVDLLTTLLVELRTRAGQELECFDAAPPDEVVLTLPARAGVVESELLSSAATKAGFSGVQLIPEPVAAAQAWAAESGGDAPVVVVLDCGGGTVDWATLRREESGGYALFSECPPGGDDKIGGEDIDAELLELVRQRAAEEGGQEAIDHLEKRGHEVQVRLRRAKELYCRRPAAFRGEVLRVGGASISISGEDILALLNDRFTSQMCAGFVDYVEGVRSRSGERAPKVLLVGGSGRIVGLREAIRAGCGCEAVWWERSEFATVLGAIQPARTLSPTLATPVLVAVVAPVVAAVVAAPVVAAPSVAAPQSRPVLTKRPAPPEAAEPIQSAPQPKGIEPTAAPTGQPLRETYVVSGMVKWTETERFGLLGLSSREVNREAHREASFEMATIPPCVFPMGARPGDRGAQPIEHPQHPVEITRAFQVGVVPVTQSLWCAVMGNNTSVFKAEHRPADSVSWYRAVWFCNRLSARLGLREAYRVTAGTPPTVEWTDDAPGYRLLTEAEWECVARAGHQHAFSGGDAPDELGWHKLNALEFTRAVGTKRPNEWGLYDLTGNVREWVWDRPGPYAAEKARDPLGATRGLKRVARGGAWNTHPTQLGVGRREAFDPDLVDASLGFRLARTLFPDGDAPEPRSDALPPTAAGPIRAGFEAPTLAPANPAHNELIQALTTMVACYSGGEPPGALARLRQLIDSRRYVEARDSIPALWRDTLGEHQRKGLRINPAVTTGFNQLNSLLKTM